MGKYDRFGIKAFTWGTEDMLKSKENSIDFAANRIATHLVHAKRTCVFGPNSKSYQDYQLDFIRHLIERTAIYLVCYDHGMNKEEAENACKKYREVGKFIYD